ncbi:hypothetical protein ACH5RR_006938 [Cinchona calisaya]|uniref:Uncharacterized protein n=1 Tax=Cinchona calisaya TaxID=153742 RepID=A0ABD3AQE0_9GENT
MENASMANLLVESVEQILQCTPHCLEQTGKYSNSNLKNPATQQLSGPIDKENVMVNPADIVKNQSALKGPKSSNQSLKSHLQSKIIMPQHPLGNIPEDAI